MGVEYSGKSSWLLKPGDSAVWGNSGGGVEKLPPPPFDDWKLVGGKSGGGVEKLLPPVDGKFVGGKLEKFPPKFPP